ncbi:MAG: SanA protein [Clostridiales bacterium]|nr:SanA protein [Clostridiales bacterium]
MDEMKRILITLALLVVAVAVLMLGINFYVVGTAKAQIIDSGDTDALGSADCILVLGAGVRSGQPSPMLKERLDAGIELYKQGVAGKIIMSGDHGKVNYDEVNTMKDYAIAQGVPSEDVFMDHAGFSTYESIYRAKEVFLADEIIIVTQEYHLYRALYIANQLGLKALGVSSDTQTYGGQRARDVREVLARNKDFFACVLKPLPTYLGEAILVSGNGNLTNDR